MIAFFGPCQLHPVAMHLKGYLYVLVAAVLWALIGPVSKLAFSQGLDPIEVAFWRALIGWVIFAAHSLWTRRLRIETRDLPVVGLFGLVGVSIFYVSYQWAVRSGGAALASVLLYTAPAWVALLSFLVLKERMGPLKIAAVAMTLAGVTLVSLGPDLAAAAGSSPGPQASPGGVAILCGLTAGFTYALYFIFGKLYLYRYTAPTLFLYAMPVGAAGLLPFVEFHPMTPTALGAVLTLSVCCTYLAYSVYYAGLRHIEATRAAVVATLEPVLAALLAFVWWDERFTSIGYLGSGLIIIAVILTVLDGRNGRDRRPGAA